MSWCSCPHFGQFMRRVSYGACRWRLAARRNFTTGAPPAAAFCERSLSNNERRHRPPEILRTASSRQIEITVTTQRVPVTVFTRQRAPAPILEQALLGYWLLRGHGSDPRFRVIFDPSIAWVRARSQRRPLHRLGRGIAWCYVGDDEFLASGPEWPRSGKVAPSNNRWSGP